MPPQHLGGHALPQVVSLERLTAYKEEMKGIVKMIKKFQTKVVVHQKKWLPDKSGCLFKVNTN